MTDLSTRIGAVTLANPIMPASGTFTEDLADVFDLGTLGAHVLKTFTAEPRTGNPTPRVCDLAAGMMNAIGIPSKGLEHFLTKALPYWARYDVPLVVSISAHSYDDFARLATAVSVPGVAVIEANISCPNIEADGRAFAVHADSTLRVVEKLRRATDLPLWVKLSPNTGEPAEVARAAESAGADALVVANTILGLAIDVTTRQPRLGNVMGGVSGPAIKPIALRMAYQAARATRIPVIGCGGIANLTDVLEYLIAGCTAVQVGTATFQSPTTMQRILAELPVWMAANGVTRLDQIIGTLREPVDSHLSVALAS